MKHKIKSDILDRKVGPRRAMLRSLATSLVLKGKIQTTATKAKAVRSIVERCVTAAKKSDLATRRRLLGYFYSEKAVKMLLNDLAPRYKERRGGYTRVIKLGTRTGDRAEMALVEFV
ncbi:MAG: 50S ribosomal protein L17 [Parcubacteria group bacterium]